MLELKISQQVNAGIGKGPEPHRPSVLDELAQSSLRVTPRQGWHGEHKTQDDQRLSTEAPQDLLLWVGSQSIQGQANGEFYEWPHRPE
jgi:hypothetical protein